MWRVIEMPDREREPGRDRIKVEPVEGMGEVPSWTGEEIPVPFEVAQGVGKLRAETAALIREGLDDEAVAKKLQLKYPVARTAVLEFIRLLRDHVEGNFPLPGADTIVIEDEGDAVTLNACFGHNTNGTLARVLTSLLSARFGGSVAQEVDPYRIRLTLPRRVGPVQIRDMLLIPPPGTR